MRYVSARWFRVLPIVLAIVGTALPSARGGAQTLSLGEWFTAPDAPNTVLLNVGATYSSPATHASEGFVASIYAITLNPPGVGTRPGSATLGAKLFSQSLGTTTVGSVSLTPNLSLLAGGTYAFLVEGFGSDVAFNYFASQDFYSGGGSLECFGPCVPADLTPANDLRGFTVTFGPALAAPEPQTWALLGTGLVGVIGLARRRRVM